MLELHFGAHNAGTHTERVPVKNFGVPECFFAFCMAQEWCSGAFQLNFTTDHGLLVDIEFFFCTDSIMYQYFVKIVPTAYVKIDGQVGLSLCYFVWSHLFAVYFLTTSTVSVKW